MGLGYKLLKILFDVVVYQGCLPFLQSEGFQALHHTKFFRDCRKLMMLKKEGKYNGCLLGEWEPRGLPVRFFPVDKAAKFVEKYCKEVTTATSTESPFRHVGEELDKN